MPLHYLEFDHCEDSDGLHSWDAVASPAPHHNRTLLTEVRGVLAQLQNALGPAGPLDEGHAWDMDLQMHDEHQRLWTLEAVDAIAAMFADDVMAPALPGKMVKGKAELVAVMRRVHLLTAEVVVAARSGQGRVAEPAHDALRVRIKDELGWPCKAPEHLERVDLT